MSILLLIAATGEFISQRLNTTVTTGTSGSSTGYIEGSLGSIGTATYNDAEGNARTIERIQYNAPNLIFRLDGTGIDDDDQVFSSIVVNATTFNRADRTSYDDDTGDGTTSWVFTVSTPWGANPNNFDLFVDQ